jgi:ferric-dicitrate binding protein FerR (iron transport regulator)
MKLKTILGQMILAAVVLSMVDAPTAMAQQTAAPASTVATASASVADVKGKVQIELPGKAPSSPSLGQVLPAETTISTGNGSILLRLEDGSQILVHANTHTVLKQPSPAGWQHLQLLLGKIKAEIQKRTGGSPPFQIGTPSAVITVRGTRFYVRVDEHKTTRVDVEEGVVEVENLKGIGKPVQVKAGFSSRVKEDSAPEEPKQAPGLDRQSGSNMGNDHDHGLSGSNQRANPPGSRGRKP